jgi:2-keto-4-pentenoate hydratase/2-oxohepta-3-ene-1,7-dioic acid hydratase in catechol pathway
VIRVANLNGRLVVAGAGEFVDVDEASGGRFGADPQAIYEQWGAFCDWAAGAALGPGEPLDFAALGPPVPAPRQVFAVALNYRDHAGEAGLDDPAQPLIFTKYPTCLTGPRASVALATPYVDWEVELVVVIGKRAEAVSVADAWQHVAGVTIGQDLSARDVQRQGPAPQFSLGKSFPGFGPTGPWVLASDAATAGQLELECLLNGERVQHARTSEMTFSVAELIAYIASICPLLPGDLLFTGTPAGVGSRRDPPVYLRAGDELVSRISGLGEIVQTFRDR